MDRRKFLAGVAAAAALPGVAPFVPAARPLAINKLPPPVYVPNLASGGNVFLSPELVAKETLRILRVELKRAYALSPDEMAHEIAQMSPADRAYVEGNS